MKTIYTVSYSTLSSLHGCPQRFIYQAIQRKESFLSKQYTDTLFGQVWHTWRKESALSRGNYPAALITAMAEWKAGVKAGATARKRDLEYLTESWVAMQLLTLGSMMPWNDVEGFSYFSSVEGKPLVEEKFSLPLIVKDDYELHLTGILDAVGFLHKGKTLVIQDDKTTSFSWPDKFFEKYDHSAQMLLYMNVVQLLAETYPDSPLGQAVSEYGLSGVSILGVFHSKGGIMLKRSPLFQYPERVLHANGAALSRLVEDFEKTIETYRSGNSAEKLGLVTDSCKEYGEETCPYLRACLAQTDEDEAAIIRSAYRIRPNAVDSN